LVPLAVCPDVNGPAWSAHDRAIEEALATGDQGTCIGAIVAWERFAFDELVPGPES
jgi:hypothetical protein